MSRARAHFLSHPSPNFRRELPLMAFRLPSRVSRAGVLVAFGGTVLLTLAFVYERRVSGAPLRLGRDEDGAFRWLTKRDLLLMRAQELEHALKESPDSTRLQRRLAVRRGHERGRRGSSGKKASTSS